MKLHLPKMLLTAVLAAVCYTPAWATSVAPADSATAAENDLLWSYVDGTVGGTFTTATNSFTNLEGGGGQANSDTTRVKLLDVNSTTQGFTVSFDLLAATVGNWANILSMCTLNGENEAAIQKNNVGDLMIYAGTFGGGTGSGDVRVGSLTDLTGKTLTFTFDGTTLSAYVDGIAQTSITYTYAEGTSPQGGLSDLYFAVAKEGNRQADVTYNNVGVWSSAMTGEEVFANVRNGDVHTATLTGNVDMASLDWENINSSSELALFGGEGGGTLNVTGSLSVASITAGSGSVTLKSDSSIVSTKMLVASNANLTLASNTTVGELKTTSQSSLTVAADQTLTAGAIDIASDTSSISIEKGAVLDLSALELPDSAKNSTAMNLISLINTTSGEGTVKLANAHHYINSGDSKLTMTFDTNYVVGTDSSAALSFNSWDSKPEWVTHTVTSNGSINVGGGAGTLEMQSGQKLLISGGTVTAGKLAIGHTSTGRDYSGSVEMTSGTLTVGEINVQNKGSNEFKNTISLKGGTLTINGAEAITYNNEEGSACTDATLGGSGENTLILKTAGTNWSVTKSATEGSTLTIGNITIDAANTNMITINSAALTGDIQNNATAQGAGLTLSGAFTVAEDKIKTVATANGFKYSQTITVDYFQGNGNYVFSEGMTVQGYDFSTFTKTDNVYTLETGELTGTIYYVVDSPFTVDGASTNTAASATGYVVYGGQTLTITANQSATMTASKILAETTGAGNITLSRGNAETLSVALDDVSTKAEGTLTITEGVTLAVGNGVNDTSTISSFNAVNLSGGTLDLNGAGQSIKNLTVDTASSILSARNVSRAHQTYTLLGLTTLNADLAINPFDDEHGDVIVKELTGTKNLSISNGGWGSVVAKLEKLTNYTGKISVESEGRTDNINYVEFAKGAFTTLEALEVSNNAYALVHASNDSTIKSVTLSNGTLKLNPYGAYTYTLTDVNVGGTGTISLINEAGAGGYQGEVNIGSLNNAEGSETSTLNITSGNVTTQRSIVNVNGGDFNGTISVTGSNTQTSRKIALNINDATVAKDAEIKLHGNGSHVALGIGASKVTVKGISDAEGASGTMKIVSGAQTYGNDAVFGAADSTKRTLEVNTAGGSYTTSATVDTNLNLEKSGSGTQNFSGDMSAFNGTVEVSGGTLGFTKTDGSVTVSSLTLSGGTLNVTNSLTLNNVIIDLTQYTAGVNIDDLVAAGNLISGENYSVSYAGGVTTVGNYTGTVEKINNSLVLTWSDLTPEKTSLTTSISGVNGLFDSENNMLTLNIDENDSLANVGDVTISGISDDIMKDILGLTGLPTDGLVGITLRDKDGVEFAASADQIVGFQGKDGIYYGAQVGSAWQYQVAYIPEPASATLGLAALMILAARRRRKA